MILYFSGTGNSRYVAQIIEEVTQDYLISMNELIKQESKERINSEQPLVFVAPIYAWRLPRVVEQLIREINFTGNKKAYFIVTCGSEAGNARKYIEKLCAAKGFELAGFNSVVMPENYIAMYDAPDKLEADEIIRRATPQIFNIAGLIKEEQLLPVENIGFIDRMKSNVVTPVFYPVFVSAKGFHTTKACTGCGKCEKVCPLNNIKMINKTPKWGNHCTHCMACICSCKVEAIEYKKASKGRVRYYNPGYIRS